MKRQMRAKVSSTPMVGASTIGGRPLIVAPSNALLSPLGKPIIQEISDDNQITIPTFPGETYNYSVDWGDGTTSENVAGDITHTYEAPGTYTIEISGDFPRIFFLMIFLVEIEIK